MKKIFIAVFWGASVNAANAQTYFHLTVDTVQTGAGNIDWSNPNRITIDNDWGYPFIKGFRGDGLTGSIDTDPRTITADGTNTPSLLSANQSDPASFPGDGFAEFESLSTPTLGFKASSVSSAPFLMLYISTENTDPDFSPSAEVTLKDIDGSGNDAVQQVSIQYRIGETGPFIAGGGSFHYEFPASYNRDDFDQYEPDLSRGPFLQGHRSIGSIFLPRNQPKIQVRIMISNSSGGNEWVGIEKISLGGVVLLPVKYHSFTATAKNNDVLLNWNAVSDAQAGYFETERSKDGVSFEKIDDVPAKGIGEFNYDFTDHSPLPGKSYYRLKIFDKTGNFIYTNTATVNLSTKDIVLSVYPTLANSKISLQVNSVTYTTDVIQIENAGGRGVKVFSAAVIAGNNTIPVDISAFPAGNYFIRLETGNSVYTARFIKQ